jgi:LuxR family transcriptional regulator, maltose regulon positive regulatory protein
MQRTVPTVWTAVGRSPQRADVYDLPDGGSLRVDSAAWFDWLAEPTTTRFAYGVVDPRVGAIGCFVTIRKERRTRGGAYWVAYRRCQGRLWKHYLGAASRLTSSYLAEVGTAALAAADDPPMK